MLSSTKYQEIVQALREEITRGAYRPGVPMPTESDLGDRFHASRGTVRRAIDVLRSEHLVQPRRGSGTYVAATSPVSAFFSLSTFEQDARGRGLTPSSRLLRAEEAPAAGGEAARLDLDPGTPVVHIERLLLADGAPVAHEARMFAADLCPGILDEDLEHRSVHWLLTIKYRVPLVRIEHVVDLRALDKREAALLDTVPGAPGYIVDRLTFSSGPRPAVWFRALHRNPEGATE